MPEWLVVFILGVIEGITEFLPISSTGHLLIAEHWLGKRSDLFNIVIQSGAVIAVLPVFSDRVRDFLFRWREPAIKDYLIKLFTAFFITGVGGVVLKKMDFKLPETVGPVAWALIIGGVMFVGIEQWIKGKPVRNELTWTIAIAVGIAQLVAAIFPGASRSGSCIVAMMLLSAARPLATEFSFLVGVPTLLAAGGLKVVSAIRKPVPGAPAEDWAMVALGTLVSAIVSFIVVKWLLRYIQTHTFMIFGWYRIALGVLLILLAGKIT